MSITIENGVFVCRDNLEIIGGSVAQGAMILKLITNFLVDGAAEVRIVTEFNHPPPGFSFSVIIDTSVMQGFNFIGHTIEGCPVVILRFFGEGYLGPMDSNRPFCNLIITPNELENFETNYIEN